MLNSLNETVHVPVLLEEVVSMMGDLQGKVIVDGTFGGGGYSRALLDAGAKKVIGIDQDPLAVKRAESWRGLYGDRLQVVNACFSEMKKITKELGENEIDGIVLDLGFSSDQLDDYERGFAFKYDGPLDMRMRGSGVSAADVLAEYDERQLADIFYKYGEERKSRQIAKLIVERREVEPLLRTQQLVDLVGQIVPSWKVHGKNPAMKVFQALRIYVNKELEELERVLPDALDLLTKGGVLGIVTFHSLEDRIVKDFFRLVGRPVAKNKYAQAVDDEGVDEKNFEVVNRKPILPSAVEVADNSRARSAKLRGLRRLR